MTPDYGNFDCLIQIRSGLELIPNQTKPLTEYTQVELTAFAQSILITEATLARYQGVKHLRLWEVLALHCYLDPVELQLNRRRRLDELKKVSHSLPRGHHALNLFLHELQPVTRDVMRSKLKCIALNREDPKQSFVSIEAFRTYADEEKLTAQMPRGVLAATTIVLDKDSQTRKRRIIESSRLHAEAALPLHIQHQMQLIESWDQFIAGKISKIPDGNSYFKELGYSKKSSTSMSTLCRPKNAPKGRIPKALR